MINVIVDILKIYELKKRLQTLISDSVANNDIMRKFIHDILMKESIEWDHELNYVVCLAHVIQLMIHELLYFLKVFACNERTVDAFEKSRLNDIIDDMRLFNMLLKICHFSRIFFTNA